MFSKVYDMKPSLSTVTEFAIAGIKSFMHYILKVDTLILQLQQNDDFLFRGKSWETKDAFWWKESAATLCLFKQL